MTQPTLSRQLAALETELAAKAEDAVSTSTTMAMLCINIGVFLSPIVLPIMADGIGDGSAQLIMVISCVGFAALGAIMSVVAVTSGCKVPAAEPETIDAVAAAIATERERECVACS